MVDLCDYEDFRMVYHNYDLDFMIKSLKEFIVSDYINSFYRKNTSLVLEVIKKLDEQLKIVEDGERKLSEVSVGYYNYPLFTNCEKMISFTYEEIITLRFYLDVLDFKDGYEYKKRDKLVRELDEYIGRHKAWLDFRKITQAVDNL